MLLVELIDSLFDVYIFYLKGVHNSKLQYVKTDIGSPRTFYVQQIVVQHLVVICSHYQAYSQLVPEVIEIISLVVTRWYSMS